MSGKEKEKKRSHKTVPERRATPTYVKIDVLQSIGGGGEYNITC